MRTRRSPGLAFVAAMTLAWSLAGCDFTDSTVSEFDDAIRAIQTESADWQVVARQLEDKLAADGRSMLANEVRVLVDSVPQGVGIEVRCGADFLGDRAVGSLTAIRDRLAGTTSPKTPYLCKPVPGEINLDLQPQDRPSITYDGYNITDGSVHAGIERAKQLIPVDDTLLGISPYAVTINTRALDLRERDTRLVLKVGNDESSASKLSVIVTPKTHLPVFVLSTVHITGTVGLHDDETWPMDDENKNVAVNAYVPVPLEGATYHWEDCVGGEVQGYLDVALTLDKGNGTVGGVWTAEYYEGTSCGRTERQKDPKSGTFTLEKNQSAPVQTNLWDQQGGVVMNLVIQNVAQVTDIELEQARRRGGR